MEKKEKQKYARRDDIVLLGYFNVSIHSVRKTQILSSVLLTCRPPLGPLPQKKLTELYM